MPVNFNDPLPSLQDSLVGLSFQFGSGGQTAPGSAKAGGGDPTNLGGNLEMRHLLDQVLSQQGSLSSGLDSLQGQYGTLNADFGGLNDDFNTLNQQLKKIYGF